MPPTRLAMLLVLAAIVILGAGPFAAVAAAAAAAPQAAAGCSTATGAELGWPGWMLVGWALALLVLGVWRWRRSGSL